MDDLEIVMKNRPGELASMGETLGKAGVSLEGGAMFLVGNDGIAHFLVEDGPRAEHALREAGISVKARRRVLVQRLDQDEPGQLGKICRAMADAGINIEVLYSDHDHQLILLVDDPVKGQVISDEWMKRRSASAHAADERIQSLRRRFAELHASGTFVMPNAWDVGSARVLESLGFEAIATTSSGHAASLGRMDQNVKLGELLDHVRALVQAVTVPVSVDAERCFGDDARGVAETVAQLAKTGAAGVSIEDYHPATGIDPLTVAVERVESAARTAKAHGMVLTARAENHLYGIDDLEDTIRRLKAYQDAGADVVYAPLLVDVGQITRLVREVRVPVNVLARPNGPSVPQLKEAGVRRVSTGGALAFAAYGALAAAGRELLSSGTSTYAAGSLSGDDRKRSFR
jgi:2-methylisocitrate lyase-like PEP mutase family enzyme